jgi:hypothetical protein
MPDYEDSRFSSTGHYPQSYAYTSSAFASGSRMTPNLDPPMQGVKRPDPIRQVSGSGTSNLRLHHHESQSFVSQQSLDSLQVVSPAEARETYIPPYTSYLDLTPLPFLPHSFPSAQDLDVERNSPYYEQGDHEVVIEKDQGEFRPSAMSRGASNASGKAGRWRDAVRLVR